MCEGALPVQVSDDIGVRVSQLPVQVSDDIFEDQVVDRRELVDNLS